MTPVLEPERYDEADLRLLEARVRYQARLHPDAPPAEVVAVLPDGRRPVLRLERAVDHHVYALPGPIYVGASVTPVAFRVRFP